MATRDDIRIVSTSEQKEAFRRGWKTNGGRFEGMEQTKPQKQRRTSHEPVPYLPGADKV